MDSIRKTGKMQVTEIENNLRCTIVMFDNRAKNVYDITTRKYTKDL